jgi:aminoglycoside 6'-N-acetyltransferase
MSALRLRPAVPADLATLQRWDEAPHVIESDPNDDWRWEAELGRELDGRPIGYLEIIDPQLEDDHYWGDCGPGLRAIDIWIGEADCLNKGYGTQMMRLALQRCFAAPEVQAVLLDPLAENLRARRFYGRLGFKFVDERDFGSDHCAVYRLERGDWSR